MNVVAKFRCESKSPWPEGAQDGATQVVRLRAVTSGPGNESWSKWTPAGFLELSITNPAALEVFEPGREYLLTFEAAP